MAITFEKLLEVGAHYGHHKAKKHPGFERFVYETKNNVSIIDLSKTVLEYEKAVKYLKKELAAGKTVLFAGTKKQAIAPIEKIANELKMPYFISRWLGGALTNFDTLKNTITKYRTMKQDQEAGKWEKMIKKERLILMRKLAKMEVNFKGLINLNKLPDILFVIDPYNEKVAVREAVKIKIPIVALIDSNFDPELIDYPIPFNDDSVKAVEYVMDSLIEDLSVKPKTQNPKSETKSDTKTSKPKTEKIKK